MNLYPVVILAGGLASRLRPITEKIPKSMVEVGGRPFIEHQLRLLRARNIKEVIILAWYRGDIIQQYAGDGRDFGLNIAYAFDGAAPLGTGGAVRKALNLLSSPFFVLYGDAYLPCDYESIQSYFDKRTQLGLMTTYYNHGQWDTSNIELAGGKILEYNKKNHTPRMQYIDYGLGIFRPAVFEQLPEGQPVDLADIYQDLVVKDQLLAYEVKERFYEIGSFEGLNELDVLLTERPDRFIKRT
jgi:NDP-sugar pyrophosphorylase family protein